MKFGHSGKKLPRNNEARNRRGSLSQSMHLWSSFDWFIKNICNVVRPIRGKLRHDLSASEAQSQSQSSFV